jgi:hypothetical protein
MLAAASITCLGLAQQAEAAVTWPASDDGTDLTLTGTGTLTWQNPPSIAFSGFKYSYWSSDPYIVFSDPGSDVTDYTARFVSPAVRWGLPYTHASSRSGLSFGHWGPDLVLPDLGVQGEGAIFPTTILTFANLTISGASDTCVDDGPVTLWTAVGTGDTIPVARVAPGPSSFSLLGLGLVGFLGAAVFSL